MRKHLIFGRTLYLKLKALEYQIGNISTSLVDDQINIPEREYFLDFGLNKD
ncbi:hypothetical protein PITCH_A1050012 [uncultured Desulfobacterium sp.]|uniref:Uncharacterized protein n=1 Tax=uncultured Desulfobacterium sp. TaxID=201089 RepID=A0A445MQW6_9BACT|nr:hypothetical protein PITCH_A1050012 [uncultured Desulfobacterium sp.]